jgi:hypothetical protein
VNEAGFRCPYFLSESKTQIRCQKDKANKSTVPFISKVSADAHKLMYCRTMFYEKCEMYKLLNGGMK